MQAVLVLPKMPETCGKCDFVYCDMASMEFSCARTDFPVMRESEERPGWCPLVPAPDRKVEMFNDEESEYKHGFNDALDEIGVDG